MGVFPTLRTGAVAQYPAERSIEFATQVVWFVDGSEQRFAERAGPLKRWVVSLDLLDESELNALAEFFRTEGGMAGAFAFTDPWDGTTHATCSLDTNELMMDLAGEGRGRVSLIVRENRS
jgi:phage-related protein